MIDMINFAVENRIQLILRFPTLHRWQIDSVKARWYIAFNAEYKLIFVSVSTTNIHICSQYHNWLNTVQ